MKKFQNIVKVIRAPKNLYHACPKKNNLSMPKQFLALV